MSIPRGVSRRAFMRGCAGGAAGVWLAGCGQRTPGRRPDQRAAVEPDMGRWAELSQLVLKRIRSAGAEYGDMRAVTTRTQRVSAQDRRISNVSESFDSGYGIRVLYHGAWGFAASDDFSPAAVEETADLAVEIARASASLVSERVKLAEEPPHVDRVRTHYLFDPFGVPLEEKTGLLLAVCEALHAQPLIARSNASLWAQRDSKMFASTEGSHLEFELLATGGGFSATAASDGAFETRGFNLPYLRTGYEQVRDADLAAAAPRVAAEAVEKLRAPTVTPGKYDLILDAEHLSLTIHESCGHPTELDRALGYEANYAGTSFLTPDKLGTFRYGSPAVSLVANNLLDGGLASTGYDDDGVSCQQWDIIREGIFSGYSTSREVAAQIGQDRSRGSNRADSWSSIPIVRISNVCLQPGNAKLDDLIADMERGLYIEGHGSFSIDQKRYNFQFGGDAFWEIRDGKRAGMLKDVIYTGITPEFWGSCDAVCDRSQWRPFGFITCGKGQPGQSGWMTHAASTARFRNVNVIAGRSAGRDTV